ncbi:MAG: hypothetical protein WAV11_02350 [Minisyncoccia bacterium]
MKISDVELLRVFGNNVTISTCVPSHTSIGAMIVEGYKLQKAHPGFKVFVHRLTPNEEKRQKIAHEEMSDFLRKLNKFEEKSRRTRIMVKEVYFNKKKG